MKKTFYTLMIGVLTASTAYSQDVTNENTFSITFSLSLGTVELPNEIEYIFSDFKPTTLVPVNFGFSAHQRISYKAYLDLGIWWQNVFPIQPNDFEYKYTTSNFEIPLTITYIPSGGGFYGNRRSTDVSGFSISFGGHYSFNNRLITGFGKSSSNHSNLGAQIGLGYSFGLAKGELVVKRDITSFIDEEIANVKRTRLSIVISIPLFTK